MPSQEYKNALNRLNLEESYRNKKPKKSGSKIIHDFFEKNSQSQSQQVKKKPKSTKKKCYSLCDKLF